MNKARHVSSTAATLLVFFALVSGTAVADEPVDEGRWYERPFAVYHLDPSEAVLLVQERLEATGGPQGTKLAPRGVSRSGANSPRGQIDAITKDPSVFSRIAEILAEIDVPPTTQVFHLTLLSASMEPNGDVDLPEGARQALDDLRQLFPFESYMVKSAAVVRTDFEARVQLDKTFTARFAYTRARAEGSPIVVRDFRLVRRIGVGVEDTQTMIQTNFTMEPGETVVLGSSQLGGEGEALIALLTAVD